MRKYFITDYGLRQVEVVPASPSLDDEILGTLADYAEGLTRYEMMLLSHTEESANNIARFQRALSNLMNAEYVVYEDR